MRFSLDVILFFDLDRFPRPRGWRVERRRDAVACRDRHGGSPPDLFRHFSTRDQAADARLQAEEAMHQPAERDRRALLLVVDRACRLARPFFVEYLGLVALPA